MSVLYNLVEGFKHPREPISPSPYFETIENKWVGVCLLDFILNRLGWILVYTVEPSRKGITLVLKVI